MKADLHAVAFLFSAVALIVLTTVLFSSAAQWLSGVAYRLGPVSNAAQWTIYAMGLLLGGWWFHDYPFPSDD